jgi:hypothetical protein
MKDAQPNFRATGLFLSGFQSIVEPTFIPLKPLTFLYGPNSSGKSSVIDAIGLFENIALRQSDQIWEKVVRWQHRSINERGSWERLGEHQGKDGPFCCLRVGVEFTVPKNWAEYVDQEINDHKSDWRDQDHLATLAYLVGRTVHLDFGIGGSMDPFRLRIAVDHRPIFEARAGQEDDGHVCWRDSQGRRSGDPGFDEEDDDYGDDGPIRIYFNHPFWQRDRGIANLVESSPSPTDVYGWLYIRKSDDYVTVFGVDFKRFDDGGLYRFHISEGQQPWKKEQSQEVDSKSGKVFPRKKRAVPKGSTIYDLEEPLEEFGLVCNALLQIGAASLKRIHVKGDRQVLRPSETTFGKSKFSTKEDSDLGEACVMLAQCLGVAETKNRKVAQNLGFARLTDNSPDHRLVNEWLTLTMPSLRGYKLRSDVHMSVHLAKKRDPFRPVDDFVYRLYLVDSQARPFEFEDVGSGFSYVFPILAALWAGNLSVVEQPELHLHPSAQCDIADVFLAAKNLGHAALVESHSENLILRVLRRIRETTNGTLSIKSHRTTPDDVAVLYFEPQTGGSTKVKQLRISGDGDFIDRWPAGFFEERTKELFGE